MISVLRVTGVWMDKTAVVVVVVVTVVVGRVAAVVGGEDEDMQKVIDSDELLVVNELDVGRAGAKAPGFSCKGFSLEIGWVPDVSRCYL